MSAKDNLNEALDSIFGIGVSSSETKNLSSKDAPPVYTPPAPTASATTYLAAGTAMEGKLQSKGDVEIAGDFNGDIISEGKVTLHAGMRGNVHAAGIHLRGCKLLGGLYSSGLVILEEGSVVDGDITACDLVCSGRVRGNLMVQNQVTLNDRAVIAGNITTGTMSMMRGAMVSGNLKMNPTAPQENP